MSSNCRAARSIAVCFASGMPLLFSSTLTLATYLFFFFQNFPLCTGVRFRVRLALGIVLGLQFKVSVKVNVSIGLESALG